VPGRWGKVYENWLTGIRDWNISRQLWWGHRIPAWYCQDDACGKVTVSETDVTECSCRGAVVQDEDVLDTWFSSWLWPFATFGWPDHTEDLARFYPGHTLVTGPDIIFFWVARMVMSGYHFMGQRPFATVYMNGIVRDTQHRKMSKSLGNGIDPLEVVKRYGADALRYTVVAGAATGTDVLLDPDDLDTSFAVGRNFANKLWNIGRFILSNLEGDWTSLDRLEPDHLELADRWILSRTQRAIEETTAHLADFRMSDAANTVYHFLWDELADWYVEQSKPRLYGSLPGAEVARGILLHVFGTSLHLLHPMMPFVTEELWSTLPGDRETMLARAAWPAPNPRWIDPAAEERFARVQDLVAAVRSIRAEYSVPPGRKVAAIIEAASDGARGAFQAEGATIERLGGVSSIEFTGHTEGAGAHAVLKDGSAVFVPLRDAIDVDRECARLRVELQRLDGQLKGVAAKLANEKFVNRAPEDVVAREREKERAWREQRETLAGKLRSLGC
jgi:valyl-tRNA synthetase